ncbi:7790_t:CDS:1, partial [Acaulospora morrowiae]
QNNVSQSSYQTDPKSDLPIVYLQDQKNVLWTKFENTYFDEIRKTSFITHLANTTQLRYHDDLGGFC